MKIVVTEFEMAVAGHRGSDGHATLQAETNCHRSNVLFQRAGVVSATAGTFKPVVGMVAEALQMTSFASMLSKTHHDTVLACLGQFEIKQLEPPPKPEYVIFLSASICTRFCNRHTIDITFEYFVDASAQHCRICAVFFIRCLRIFPRTYDMCRTFTINPTVNLLELRRFPCVFNSFQAFAI